MENLASSSFSKPESYFSCGECGRRFRLKHNLQRHVKTVHGGAFQCDICKVDFTRKDNLANHIQKKHAVSSPEKCDTLPEVTQRETSTQNETNQEMFSKNEKHEHKCETCQKCFTLKRNLDRHIRSVHGVSAECSLCKLKFTRRDNLMTHLKQRHGDFSCATCEERFLNKADLVKHWKSHRYTCDFCKKNFSTKESLKAHIKIHLRALKDSQKSQESSSEIVATTDKTRLPEPVEGETSALNRGFINTRFTDVDESDPPTFMQNKKEAVRSVLEQNLKFGIKWYIAIKVFFKRTSGEGEQLVDPVFRSDNSTLLNINDFETQFDRAQTQILETISNFQREGSNWQFDSIIHFDVNIAEYVPLAGSSYIVLPTFIQNKKAVLNFHNEDQKCFLWCLLAARYVPILQKQAEERGVKFHSGRLHHYTKYEKELNMKGISLPVSIADISKFEYQNPTYSINVISFKENKNNKVCDFFPLFISENRAAEVEVDLLFDVKEGKSHYSLIRNLSRLLSHLTEHNGASFYCRYCLQRLSSERVLVEHKKLCSQHSPQAIKMPAPGKHILQFSDYKNIYPVPFTIYADFEAFISPTQNPGTQNTQILAEHKPCGFCYVVIGKNGLPIKAPVEYRGENVVQKFIESLLEEEKEILPILKRKVPLTMTAQDKISFSSATHCGLCKKPFHSQREKARDHFHETGKYRQAAHISCNRSYSKPKHIPVILHNLRGYDSHLIFQKLGAIKHKRITCISNTIEKYVSFSVGSLRFLDSLQFLNASLATLVANLAKEGSQKFHITRSIFSEDEKLKLLLRKGLYPYEYVTDHKKFDECELPPKEAFYSSLTEDHISEDDYEHAKSVWEKFDMRNLGDYHDLYLKSDVLLLADVFQNFRSICIKYYELDPCHFYTSPGLSFQACLKMTEVRLELLTEIDMHLFIEAGIRGGVSVISHRLGQANNKYMEGEYQPENPSKYIMYWDMNNLYGYAMSQHLPEGGFRFLDETEIASFDVKTKPTEGAFGWILEVDLDYPKHLHAMHNDYPLAPEKVQITPNMLSEYSSSLMTSLNCKMGKVKKLVPNLQPKKNYIVHFTNLKMYLDLGMILVRIHRILQFSQSQWLQKYIQFNTDKRKEAKNEFEKDFFKLMNNSVYGKFLESLRNRQNVSFATTQRRARKLIARPQFREFRIFDENLVAVHSIQTNILLNRPIYAGFAVLELSKVAMYNFHYGFVKSTYGEKATLLFTDTDSLCYEIETDDIYTDMLSNLDFFDTSEYPPSHKCFSNQNKKVLGKMKDECFGRIARQFAGLRSKMYSLQEQGGKSKNVGKGIVKTVLKKKICHEDYVKAIMEKTISRAPMTMIRSKAHHIRTIVQHKITLSPFDDKRYILDDGITTLAHGHKDIVFWEFLRGNKKLVDVFQDS